MQGDAVRNSYGNMMIPHWPSPGGVFAPGVTSDFNVQGPAGSGWLSSNVTYDISRVVPTAIDNRVCNISSNYWRRVA